MRGLRDSHARRKGVKYLSAFTKRSCSCGGGIGVSGPTAPLPCAPWARFSLFISAGTCQHGRERNLPRAASHAWRNRACCFCFTSFSARILSSARDRNSPGPARLMALKFCLNFLTETERSDENTCNGVLLGSSSKVLENDKAKRRAVVRSASSLPHNPRHSTIYHTLANAESSPAESGHRCCNSIVRNSLIGRVLGLRNLEADEALLSFVSAVRPTNN